MSFQDLNLDARLQRAIDALNYTTPTDIQREAIPLALAGKDLMASAQTGTGKTAAFMLPTLHRLLNNPAGPGRGPRVLVLTPTRELAQQVKDAVRDFGKFTQLVSGDIVGGVSYFHQERLLRKPLDILVATPGRLMDHMRRGRIDFSRLEMLILDEADRMLDMGFIEDVEAISAETPEERQTLLFSATLEGDIERVARKLLKEPARVQVAGVKTRHEAITQQLLAADGMEHKEKLLNRLLADESLHQAVVFVATKRSADDLADSLHEQGHQVAALHGDMKQSQRQRVLERLHGGRLRVVIATDVAARGLDVKALSHVINFDLPMQAEDYVHRIGRTGRGGASGTAFSLVGPSDWPKLFRIERLLGSSIDDITLEGLEPRRGRPAARSGGGGGRGGFRDGPRGGYRGNGGGCRGNRDGGGYRSEGGGYRGNRDGGGFRSEGAARPDGERSFRRDDRPRSEGFRSDGPRREFAPRTDGGAEQPREFRRSAPREGGERSFNRDERPRRFGERSDSREFRPEGARRPRY